MRIPHPTLVIEVLGDPHQGRAFANVPLHRRGERELSQWADLRASLMMSGIDVHVTMGDLFDKAIVPYDVVLETAHAYRVAALTHPLTEYYVLAGNHDVFREADRYSALHVFAALLADLDNVTVVFAPAVYDDLAFFGWDPFRRADELVLEHKAQIAGCTTAFGHWDLKAHGEKDENLVPAAALAACGIEVAVSGHEHKATEEVRHGIKLIYPGSMQPYAHGEGDLYVTVTPAQLAADPAAYKNKVVRVRLAPGEDAPDPVDCLGWSITRDDAEATDEGTPDVELEDFSYARVLAEAFDEEQVPEDIRELVLDKLEEGQNG